MRSWLGEHRALSEIPAMARPVLERITAGEVLTPAFRAEVLAVNEAVRGHIRRDLPYHAGFPGAIDAARARESPQALGNEDPAPLRMSEDLASCSSGTWRRRSRSRHDPFSSSPRGGFMTLLVEGSQARNGSSSRRMAAPAAGEARWCPRRTTRGARSHGLRAFYPTEVGGIASS